MLLCSKSNDRDNRLLQTLKIETYIILSKSRVIKKGFSKVDNP